MNKTIITVLITALIVSGGMYIWQLKQVPKTTEQITVNTVNTPDTQSETKETIPTFDTLDKYLEVTVGSGKYQTSNPTGFKRVSFGSELNFADVWMDKDVYVLVENSWPNNSNDMNDILPFYIEIYDQTLEETTFHGPFEGPVTKFVE